jgi:hypothetical protein
VRFDYPTSHLTIHPTMNTDSTSNLFTAIGEQPTIPSSLPATFRLRSLAPSATSDAPVSSPSELFTEFAFGGSGEKNARLTRQITIMETQVVIIVDVLLEDSLTYHIGLDWDWKVSQFRSRLDWEITIPTNEHSKSSARVSGRPGTLDDSNAIIGPDNYPGAQPASTFPAKVREALRITGDLWLKALVKEDKAWASDPIVGVMQHYVNWLLVFDLPEAWRES